MSIEKYAQHESCEFSLFGNWDYSLKESLSWISEELFQNLEGEISIYGTLKKVYM